MSVVAVSVSMWREATVTTRHSKRSVTLVALLTPGVSAVVVAELLPESRLVALEQQQPPHPLRALPEVQVRYQQPRGSAVLGGQRPAVVAPHDPRLGAGDVLERQVRRVAPVAERQREAGALHVDTVEEPV